MPFKALCHPQFVQEAKFLSSDCIQEHSEPPYYVNPLSVAEGKKLRLVIDLRQVNPCLFKLSFKTLVFYVGSGVVVPSRRYLPRASEIFRVYLAILRQASLFPFRLFPFGLSSPVSALRNCCVR